MPLLDQLRASREIYKREAAEYDSMSDADLKRVLDLASGSTLKRVRALSAAEVPVVPNLDRLVAERVVAGRLDMDAWHCDTTHCRAGTAVDLAGEAGARLEALLGPETAGRLIYEASTGRLAPDFYASNDDAIADIKRCAELAS